MIVTLRADDMDGAQPITHELGTIEISETVLDGCTIENWFDAEWAEWQEQTPQPDSYSLFVPWLASKYDLKIRGDCHVYTFDMR